MAEVGIAVFAAHLDAHHKQAAVLFFHDIFGHQWPGETGPAGPGLEFVGRAEQRFTGNNINIDALFFIIPVFIIEGRFSAVFLGNLVLQRRQFLLQNTITGF